MHWILVQRPLWCKSREHSDPGWAEAAEWPGIQRAGEALPGVFVVEQTAIFQMGDCHQQLLCSLEHFLQNKQLVILKSELTIKDIFYYVPSYQAEQDQQKQWDSVALWKQELSPNNRIFLYKD